MRDVFVFMFQENGRSSQDNEDEEDEEDEEDGGGKQNQLSRGGVKRVMRGSKLI